MAVRSWVPLKISISWAEATPLCATFSLVMSFCLGEGGHLGREERTGGVCLPGGWQTFIWPQALGPAPEAGRGCVLVGVTPAHHQGPIGIHQPVLPHAPHRQRAGEDLQVRRVDLCGRLPVAKSDERHSLRKNFYKESFFHDELSCCDQFLKILILFFWTLCNMNYKWSLLHTGHISY